MYRNSRVSFLTLNAGMYILQNTKVWDVGEKEALGLFGEENRPKIGEKQAGAELCQAQGKLRL